MVCAILFVGMVDIKALLLLIKQSGQQVSFLAVSGPLPYIQRHITQN